MRDRPGELVSELHYVQAGPTPRFLKLGQPRVHVSHSPTHCSTVGPLFLKTTSFQASLRKQVSSNLLGTSGSKSPLKISRLIPLKGKGRVCLSEGFSALALAVCGARDFFVAGSCPVHYGMFKGILGLYPRDARSTSLQPRQSKVSPDTTKGPQGGKILPG